MNRAFENGVFGVYDDELFYSICVQWFDYLCFTIVSCDRQYER